MNTPPDEQKFMMYVTEILQNWQSEAQRLGIEPFELLTSRGADRQIAPAWRNGPASIDVSAAIHEMLQKLDRDEIREPICAALKSGYESIFELSKAIVPVLITLQVTGIWKDNLDPVWAATVIVVLGKLGADTLCHEYKKKK